MRPELAFAAHAEVAALREQLSTNPELWNEHRLRTGYMGSPHREIDDIWCRYNDLSHLDPKDPSAFNGPHESVWYPNIEKLTALPPVCQHLATVVGASTIGGVLITRVPAGCKVHWHQDGGWHASAHRKWCISVASNAEQTFEFEDEQMRTRAGECFEFFNEHPHAVFNPSKEDRVSVICSLKDF